MKMRFLQTLVFAASLAVGTQAAQAAFLDVTFEKVSNNNAEDLAGQLGLTVYDATMANSTFGLSLLGNDVLFAYTNNVGIASAISEIYLDNGPVVSLLSVHNSPSGSTSFIGGSANPGNLPGGNTLSPPFVATSSLSADASGNPSKGVDSASDILGIAYSTTSGLTGIEDAIADGSLRVGLHIRSIGIAGGSDSYVNGGGPTIFPQTPAVPEPSTLVLWSLGAIGLVGLGYRRRKRAA